MADIYTQRAKSQIANPINVSGDAAPLLNVASDFLSKSAEKDFAEARAIERREEEQAKRLYEMELNYNAQKGMQDLYTKYQNDPVKLEQALKDLDIKTEGTIIDKETKLRYKTNFLLKSSTYLNKAQENFGKTQQIRRRNTLYATTDSNNAGITLAVENFLGNNPSPDDLLNIASMTQSSYKNINAIKDDGTPVFSIDQREQMTKQLETAFINGVVNAVSNLEYPKRIELFSNIKDKEYLKDILPAKAYAKVKEIATKGYEDAIIEWAENSPKEVMEKFTSGELKVDRKTLDTISKLKSNAQVMRDYEENIKQNQTEEDLFGLIYSDASYDEKKKTINDLELKGDISGNYAAKARRVIQQWNPAKEKLVSDSQSISDVLQRVYDLNESTNSSEEYLLGVRDIRNEILERYSQGLLTTQDVNKLNNSIGTATRKRIAQETDSVSMKFGMAGDYLKNTLPPQYRNEAIRQLFYETYGDENIPETVYIQKARKIASDIISQNRAKVKAMVDNPVAQQAAPSVSPETKENKPQVTVDDFFKEFNL